jgi:hypothetical protein
MRLAHARLYLLQLRALPELPSELRPRLNSILRTLDAKSDGTEAYRVAPLRLRGRGDKVAKEILDFFTDLMGGL